MSHIGWAALIVVTGMSGGAATIFAQGSDPAGLDVGVSVGIFADYPTHFSGQSCEQKASAVAARFGRRITSILSLDAGVVAAFGVGDRTCIFPSSPAPLDGGLFNRAVFRDGIVGQSFFATTVSAVLQPLPLSTVSPSLHVGSGRLWDKRLWTWLYGGGIRVRFGANTITAEAERWNLGYDLNLELWIFRDSGAHELQRVDVLPQRPRPYVFRLGWARRVD